MTDLAAPFTVTAFAEMVGVSQPAISAAVKEGRVDGSGSMAQALLSYTERLREQAAGRGGMDMQQTLTIAKAEEAQVKTALARIEYHKRLGELVLIEDVQKLVNDWAHHTHREIRGMVEKLRAEIESAHKIKLNDEVVSGSVEPAIERIGGFARQCTLAVGASRDGVQATH